MSYKKYGVWKNEHKNKTCIKNVAYVYKINFLKIMCIKKSISFASIKSISDACVPATDS